jgi:hypothetical protein
MKRFLCAAALTIATGPTFAADVGVSISVGEPGFYGRIDIGDVRPQVVYAQPLVIERGPVLLSPIYLYVPPGHAKNWRKYCHHYNACGRPVYFVRDSWYNNVYVPHYREQHGNSGGGNGNGNRDRGPGGHGHGRGHGG